MAAVVAAAAYDTKLQKVLASSLALVTKSLAKLRSARHSKWLTGMQTSGQKHT
jgi:hypothetical protein